MIEIRYKDNHLHIDSGTLSQQETQAILEKELPQLQEFQEKYNLSFEMLEKQQLVLLLTKYRKWEFFKETDPLRVTYALHNLHELLGG